VLNIPARSPVTNGPIDPALAAVADLHARGDGVIPNFMPPEPGRFEAFIRTALKRRTASLAVGAVSIVVFAALAFGFQARTLHALETEMDTLAPQAADAAILQERIRTYRGWFDAGAPTLDIASGLAGAFPEEGSVWLKSASIKSGATVTCGGKATNSRAWLDMLESLRVAPAFGNVQVSQVRGDAPLEFSFSCTWLKGAS
jgi:hypothetical protein